MASPKMDVLRSSLSCGSDGTAFRLFPISGFSTRMVRTRNTLKALSVFRRRYIIPHMDPHDPRLCTTPHDSHVTYSLRTIFSTY